MDVDCRESIAAEEEKLTIEIGKRLYALREEKGLTQEQLATMAGLQSNSIYRYEVGERKMSLVIAIRIAKALQVSIRKLVPEEYLIQESNALDPDNVLEIFYQLDEEDRKSAVKHMLGLLALKKTA